MWFFNSPEVVFGEDALSYLDEIAGRRAFIVTDENMVKLGFVDRVIGHFESVEKPHERKADRDPKHVGQHHEPPVAHAVGHQTTHRARHEVDESK